MELVFIEEYKGFLIFEKMNQKTTWVINYPPYEGNWTRQFDTLGELKTVLDEMAHDMENRATSFPNLFDQ